jgi:hypothetical protein
MTLDEWMACAAQQDLSGELWGAGDRSLRCFACACLRRVWSLLPCRSCRDAVEAYEQFADGLLSAADLVEACVQAEMETDEGLWCSRGSWGWDCPTCEADWDAQLRHAVRMETVGQSLLLATRAAEYAVELAAWHARPANRETVRLAERRAQHPLFCDLFEKPRHVRLEPSWLRVNGGLVNKAAQVIHAGECFAELPILADALEDAGCTDRAILDHCRSPGPHVRGCWVIGLILGKP